MKQSTLSKDSKTQTALKALEGSLTGRVIRQGDAGFDDARKLYYGWIDRRPEAIARVESAGDVARIVTFAREAGMPLAIRSGGHSFPGHSMVDGGIVIDLSKMNRIEIDPGQRTAWTETGITAVQYTHATSAHGLLTGFGDSGTVGIGGLTLGGGVGFFVRKFGLTIDDLLSAEIVTADGQTLQTDAKNHPDLFWAIRGGGGNFGVATRFQFRLHPVPQVLGGILMIPVTPDVIRSFVAEAEAASEELSTIANIMRVPPMPFVPAEHHGKLMIMAMMVYAGDPETGRRAIEPFRKLAQPAADMVRPMEFKEMYAMEGPHPAAVASRSMFIDSVDAGTSEAILQSIENSHASMAVVQIRVLGGAMARIPKDATAFAHRARKMLVNVAALYEDHAEHETHEAWASEITKTLTHGNMDVYVNFLGDEGKARVRDAYPGSIWARLTGVKARYDPGNLFCQNHNIPPANGNS